MQGVSVTLIKRKAFFLFCKNKNSNYIFLQDTHSNPDDVKFWTSQWGHKIICSHASTHSAGVAILFNKLPGKVVKVVKVKTLKWTPGFSCSKH